jgi:hypothetical protein
MNKKFFVFIKQIKRNELQILGSGNCVQFMAKHEASSHLKFSVADSEINTDVLFGIGSPDTITASATFRVYTCVYENTSRHIQPQSNLTSDIYGCKNLEPHTIITRSLLPPRDRHRCKRLVPAVRNCEMSVGNQSNVYLISRFVLPILID